MSLDPLVELISLPREYGIVVRGGAPFADYMERLLSNIEAFLGSETRRTVNYVLSMINPGYIYFATPNENGVYPTNSLRLYISSTTLYHQYYDGATWQTITSTTLAGLLTLADVKLNSPSQSYALLHNGFASKQGGVAGEYYHLSAAQVASLHDAMTLGTANGLTLVGQQLSLPTIATTQFGRVSVDDANTYMDKDGSGNLTLTDAVVGTRTLKQLGCPTYRYIKATGQAEGDLHLSDGTNWAVSKALIKYIRIITASTDWDLYVLQNDNGYVANDATIPALKIGDGISGNANLWVDLPYKDEDASNEVHLYWVSNSGVDTATIIVQGYELL